MTHTTMCHKLLYHSDCGAGFLYVYSRTPEIETSDLSQSHAGLNLSQFQINYLLRINSSVFFKLFESIPDIVTTLTK